MVIAGLISDGVTEITSIEHIDSCLLYTSRAADL